MTANLKKKSFKISKFSRKNKPILEKVLRYLGQYGWVNSSFSGLAHEFSLTPLELKKLYPEGLLSIKESWDQELRLGLRRGIRQTLKNDPLRVRDKIKCSVMCFFTLLEPYKDTLGSYLIHAAHPSNWMEAQKYFFTIADLIWEEAGDRSTDYNYYTKRLLLTAILQTTTLVWLNDGDEYNKTRAFMDRRIEDTVHIGKGIQKIKERVTFEAVAQVVRERLKMV